MKSTENKKKYNFYYSLRHKLISVIAAALSLSMLIASFLFVLYYKEQTEKNLKENIYAIAKITTERSVAAMAFADKDTADQNINALLSIENIRLGCLYDKHGNLFSHAVNLRFKNSKCEENILDMEESLLTQDQHLIVRMPVLRKNVVSGNLIIVTDLTHLYKRMLNFGGASLLVSLLSSLIAYILTIRLQQQLIRPIESLSQAADQVTHTQDYSIRAQRLSNDEVGDLVDSFNGMLERIDRTQERLQEIVDELEEQSLILKYHAERSDIQKQEVQEMLAAASHDLKQPLQAMAMFVVALQSKTGNSDVIVEKLERSIDNMGQLFTDLLDVSSLEKRIKVKNKEDTIFLPDIFNQLLVEHQIVAEQKNLTFDVKSVDCKLLTHESTFQRIIRNLLSNALRYTLEGGIRLECKTEENGLIIEVIDTGIGIHENKINDIFREFIQANPDEKISNQGRGLGLTIVKRCCELLDYKIEAESKFGHGSTFRISIPENKIIPNVSVDIAHKTDEKQTEKAHKEIIPLKPPLETKDLHNNALDLYNFLAKKHVLLIDDNSLVLDSISCLLKTWKVDVTCFSSISLCIKYLIIDPDYVPDMIISDYQLGFNELGIDLIELLKDHYNSDIPALIITGIESDSTIKVLRSKGFCVLRKPIKPAKLRALLSNML